MMLASADDVVSPKGEAGDGVGVFEDVLAGGQEEVGDGGDGGGDAKDVGRGDGGDGDASHVDEEIDLSKPPPRELK